MEIYLNENNKIMNLAVLQQQISVAAAMEPECSGGPWLYVVQQKINFDNMSQTSHDAPSSSH